MALRVTGLYSGLDIDQLVADLMRIERRPVDVRIQSRSRLQAELDAWRDLNSKLKALETKLADLKGTTIWDKLKAESSNPGVLTVSLTGTAAAGTYSVTVNRLAQNTIYQSTTAINDPSVKINFTTPSTKVDFFVNRSFVGTVSLANSMSLNDIADAINTNTAVNKYVTATVAEVSPGSYSLVISGNNTGEANDFSYTEDGGTFTELNMQVAQIAQDAELTVGGVRYKRSTNTFDGVIAGLRLTAVAAGTSTVTVAQDTDALVNAVRAVVDAYNAFADAVNKYTSYDPNTKQGGALQGDARVSQLLSSVRRKLMDDVPGLPDSLKNLSQIGINTDPLSSGNIKAGRLTLDESKLREKLAADPAGVQQLFRSAGGVATRTVDYIAAYTRVGGILPGTEDALQRRIDGLQQTIDYWEQVILPKREETLRQKFTRLELALQQYQSQSQWLVQQLAALPAWSAR